MRRGLESVERMEVLLIGSLIDRQISPVRCYVGDWRDVSRGRSLGGCMKKRMRRIIPRRLIAEFVAGGWLAVHRRHRHHWLLLLLLLLLAQSHIIVTGRIAEFIRQKGECGRGGSVLVVSERCVAGGRAAGRRSEVEGTSRGWWYLQSADRICRGSGRSCRVLREYTRRLLLIGGRRYGCRRILLLLLLRMLTLSASLLRHRRRRYRDGDGRCSRIALTGSPRYREDALTVLRCYRRILQALQQIKLLKLGCTGCSAASISGEVFWFRCGWRSPIKRRLYTDRRFFPAGRLSKSMISPVPIIARR